MIDLHVHILPGVDDGAANIETSVMMAQMAAADGIDIVVATPHVLKGAFDNNREDIRLQVDDLQGRLVQQGVKLQVRPGAEYYLEVDLPELMAKGELLTLNDSGYLLVELPATLVPEHTGQVLYELQLQGAMPVIAHPERNAGFMRCPQLLQDLIDRGVLAQVTAASVTGVFGRTVRQTALSFIEKGLVQVLASDAHSLNGRAPVLARAADEVSRYWGRDVAQALVKDNPLSILEGSPLEMPVAKRRRSWWQRRFG